MWRNCQIKKKKSKGFFIEQSYHKFTLKFNQVILRDYFVRDLWDFLTDKMTQSLTLAENQPVQVIMEDKTPLTPTTRSNNQI